MDLVAADEKEGSVALAAYMVMIPELGFCAIRERRVRERGAGGVDEGP